MKKFIRMEDNEDGTVAISMCFDGREVMDILLTMSMDEMLKTFFQIAQDDPKPSPLEPHAVYIPNGADDAGSLG